MWIIKKKIYFELEVYSKIKITKGSRYKLKETDHLNRKGIIFIILEMTTYDELDTMLEEASIRKDGTIRMIWHPDCGLSMNSPVFYAHQLKPEEFEGWLEHLRDLGFEINRRGYCLDWRGIRRWKYYISPAVPTFGDRLRLRFQQASLEHSIQELTAKIDNLTEIVSELKDSSELKDGSE